MTRISIPNHRIASLITVGLLMISIAACDVQKGETSTVIESSYSQLESAGQLATLSDAAAVVRIIAREGTARSTPLDSDPKVSQRGYGFAYFTISDIRFLPEDTVSPDTVGGLTSIAFPVVDESSAINREADVLYWSAEEIPVGKEVLVMLSSRDHGDPRGSLIVTGFGRIDRGSVRFSSIPPGSLGDKDLDLAAISAEIVKGLEIGRALRSRTTNSWGSGPPSIPIDGSIQLTRPTN